jgi:D-glycero-D-manno-heptose 1,7-bisphosphate phosphatase
LIRRAVFLDRDGTLNELVPDPISGRPESPLRAADVELIAGAADAARRLQAAGWLLIGVSNQPAAAKGTATLHELAAVQARVVELLAREGVTFADFRICHHHPQAVVADLAGPCDCRKPNPGMLVAAAAAAEVTLASSWMIGDTDSDVLAGQAAGAQTVLLEHPGSAHKRKALISPTATFPELGSATTWILSNNLVG